MEPVIDFDQSICFTFILSIFGLGLFCRMLNNLYKSRAAAAPL